MLTKQIEELRRKQEKGRVENKELKNKQKELEKTIEDENFKYGSLVVKYNTIETLLSQSDAKLKQ
jgi:hypothetical protein